MTHAILVDVTRCTGCEKCHNVCPTECIEMRPVQPLLNTWYWPEPARAAKRMTKSMVRARTRDRAWSPLTSGVTRFPASKGRRVTSRTSLTRGSRGVPASVPA